MPERYIGVNRFCEWLKHIHTGFTKDELAFRDELIEFLQGNNGIENVLPTADVVPVVRCEKCRYRSQYPDKNGFYKCGGLQTEDGDLVMVVKPDFFCAFGERRADGKEKPLDRNK